MKQGVLKTDDLNPDGVRIIIKWDELVIGASVFVPCINTEEAMRQAAKIIVNKGYETEAKVVIEDDILGIRIWRTV
jgi:phosphoribosylamine-glycine ligase